MSCNCNDTNVSQNQIFHDQFERITTVDGNYEANLNGNAPDDTIIVTGATAPALFATITLGDAQNGQKIAIVTAGAPANIDAGDNPIADGRTYVPDHTRAVFTFVAGATRCDEGQWVADCCAVLPPPPVA